MLAKESSGGGSNFDLPDELLSILPSDPFQQLDIARKITSIALSTRVSKLESDYSILRSKLGEKDELIAELQSQIESLDASLSDTTDKLVRADQEKENLLKENETLSNTVNKLNRDVSKLEVFKKTLLQSLKEEEDSPHGKPSQVAKQIQSSSSFSSGSVHGEDDASLPPSKSSSMRSVSETGNSFPEDSGSVEMDGSRYGSSQGPLLASYNNTPKLTPPGSPPSYSVTASPRRTSLPVSPRRHSISFSTTRGVFDDNRPSSVWSSMPSGHHGSIPAGSTDHVSQGRTRVDGKEFFRQVRSRLSYEQFSAFLANVKDLNSHKQTREETLRKADEVFGPDNKDLYAIFEGLITRNVH